MPASLNHVTLIGAISQYGVEARQAANGTAYAAFTLALTETTPAGQTYTTLIPCECWGRRHPEVLPLAPGTPVVIEGKLARRKKGDAWDLVVSSFSVSPLASL